MEPICRGCWELGNNCRECSQCRETLPTFLIVQRQIIDNLRHRLEKITKARDHLLEAIKKHHDQKADDRCWMDDNELYIAAGLAEHDNTVGDRFAMLKNCINFVNRRCEEGGNWKSYDELLKENATLRKELMQSILSKPDRARTVEEVKRLQASIYGCCDRHVDHMACDCLQRAREHDKRIRMAGQ